MKKIYLLFHVVGLLLVQSSFAQAPTITSLSPTRNQQNAPVATNVDLTFSQSVSSAPATLNGLRVFSAQRDGQLQNGTGGVTTANGNTQTFNPANDFRPGETIFTTITSAAQSSDGTSLARGQVHQFTTAVGGTGHGNFTTPVTNPNPGMGSSPYSVALGDGDSDLDLLATNSDGDKVSVRLNQAVTPTISGFAGSPNPVCASSPITFTATVGNVTGSYNYTLSNGSSPLSGTANTTVFSQNVSAIGSGPQSFTLTVSNGGAPATAVTSLTVSPSNVTRLYVKANATGANTGLSWQDAFTDLQSALKYPCVGNLREIWIARGVYNRGAQPFTMLPDVAIYGGFEGTETELSQRPPINLSNPPSTTLTGQAPFTGFYNIIENLGNLTNTAVLDGVEITIPTSGSLSSGITNRSDNGQVCSPQFRNLLFRGYRNTGNEQTSNGLFVQNDAASGGEVNPSFVNCVFRDNQSINLIGRFYNVSFTNGVVRPQFTNCVIANHTGDSFLLNLPNGGQIQPRFFNCSF